MMEELFSPKGFTNQEFCAAVVEYLLHSTQLFPQVRDLVICESRLLFHKSSEMNRIDLCQASALGRPGYVKQDCRFIFRSLLKTQSAVIYKGLTNC